MKSVDVKVVGEDSKGNQAGTSFTIHFTDETNVDNEKPKEGEGQRQDRAPALDQAEAPAEREQAQAIGELPQADLVADAAKGAWVSVDAQAMEHGRHALLTAREALLADFAAIDSRPPAG